MKKIEYGGGGLTGPSLTTASLESLRTVANLRTLSCAHFGTDAWTDADFKRLIWFEKLKDVNGEFRLITDAGLKTVVELQALEKLNTKGSKVIAEGVAAFRKPRPDV